MAPMRPQMILSKEKFSTAFKNFRTTAYVDASPRGGPSKAIRSIDWNPLGTLIACGSTDRTIRVWNPEKVRKEHSIELKGHEGVVEQVRFNPVKESELCSISSDGIARFWDVRTKTLVNEVKGLGHAFTLVWHPEGECAVVGNKADMIFVLDPTSPTPIAQHQQNVQTNEIAFAWCGTRIFVTTGEGRVKSLQFPSFAPSWNPKPGHEEARQLTGHVSPCLSIALQPTARWLATGGNDSIIALWDTKVWQCARTLIEMVGPVRTISFSFDGSFIVGGSDEGNDLSIAHTETGEYVHKIKTTSPCPLVAWHPSKYHLAYVDSGGLKIIGNEAPR